MPSQFTVKMISMILALFAGYSFPFLASAHEKDLEPCQQRLTGEKAPVLRVTPSMEWAMRGVSWVRLAEERGQLLVLAIDKYNGDAQVYAPEQSLDPIGTATHLTISAERSPFWIDQDGESRLMIGEQALALDSSVPSRVRIMPVGLWAGEKVERDEDGHEVRISISADNELHVVYPNGPHAEITLKLASSSVRHPQVLRSPSGSILILIGRAESSSILELRRGAVAPVAVVNNSFLFNSENQGPFVVWSGVDATSGALRLRISKLDSLTSPLASFPLENGEIVKDYDVLSSVSKSGTLAVLTNRRLLLFNLKTTAELNGDQSQ